MKPSEMALLLAAVCEAGNGCFRIDDLFQLFDGPALDAVDGLGCDLFPQSWSYAGADPRAACAFGLLACLLEDEGR